MRALLVLLGLTLSACAALNNAPGTPPASTVTPAIVTASPPGAALPTVAPARATAGTAPGPILLVSNHRAAHVSFVHPQMGVITRLEVGESPWGIALAPGGIAYVSTARGVAAVDASARRRTAFAAFPNGSAYGGTGEYRQGGMGIAVSPDGKQVFAGVHSAGATGSLEVLDTATMTFVGSVPVGVRPFDVLASRDGREVYSIDHDSYSVTVVDRATLRTRASRVAPLGNGAYDKPHYAAIAPDGRLLLPFQGRTLLSLNPADGSFTARPLSANTHQHGTALAADGRTLLIVGTGAAGGATGAPALTVLDLVSSTERNLPLKRAHERIALSSDGRTAFLSGGYLLGGWDGITIVNLPDGAATEVAIPDLPLDIAVLP